MRFKEFKTLTEAPAPVDAEVLKALDALGFSNVGADVDAAIKQFQQAYDLAPTGDLTPDTQTTLNALLGIPAAQTATPKAAAPAARPMAPQTATKNSVSPAEVSSYLSTKGLDRNQVLGILANIKRESNFNSGAVGDNGTSGGLFQHHADRFSKMAAAAGGNNKWQANWKAQVDFALSEPAGRQYASMKFKTPEQATEWWTRKFEIPANVDKEVAIRQSMLSGFA